VTEDLSVDSVQNALREHRAAAPAYVLSNSVEKSTSPLGSLPVQWNSAVNTDWREVRSLMS